ncbi:MAG: hypothetical protein WC934_10765, partial [Acidithiobacillus sp.]
MARIWSALDTYPPRQDIRSVGSGTPQYGVLNIRAVEKSVKCAGTSRPHASGALPLSPSGPLMSSASPYPVLRLRPKEDRRLRAGHLWVYSNEIDVQKTPLTAVTP